MSAVLNNLQCPVLFSPLTDAVLLAPCGHTVSKAAVHILKRDLCPVCRHKVKAFYPNYAVRTLAVDACTDRIIKKKKCLLLVLNPLKNIAV